jgi:hypothetical protein
VVAHLRDRFGVDPVLRVLGIAPSTFYGWLAQNRAPSARRRVDEQVLAEITDIHARSGGTYGSPRVHATLRRRGVRVSRKRVERLMRQAGLQGAFLRRRREPMPPRSMGWQQRRHPLPQGVWNKITHHGRTASPSPLSVHSRHAEIILKRALTPPPGT